MGNDRLVSAERYEAAVDAAQERMTDNLPLQISRSVVMEFLHQAIDDAAFLSDFPSDMGHEEIRAPWLYAAAERLAAVCIDVMREQSGDRYALKQDAHERAVTALKNIAAAADELECNSASAHYRAGYFRGLAMRLIWQARGVIAWVQRSAQR